MRLIKLLILWIKSLKWRRDILKYEKKAKEVSFKTNPQEFVEYLYKGERLETKGLSLQRELDSLK